MENTSTSDTRLILALDVVSNPYSHISISIDGLPLWGVVILP